MAQYDPDIGRCTNRRFGPQAVMHDHGVALIFKKGCDGEQAEGRHAIGHGRHIFAARQPIVAGRMDQNYSQGRYLLNAKRLDS